MLGRNEPLRPLRPAEFTDKILRISGFSIPQCVSGSLGESTRIFATHRRRGAEYTVMGILPGARHWDLVWIKWDGSRGKMGLMIPVF